nr:unnamed protein product [Callosobruchus chinensis]
MAAEMSAQATAAATIATPATPATAATVATVPGHQHHPHLHHNHHQQHHHHHVSVTAVNVDEPPQRARSAPHPAAAVGGATHITHNGTPDVLDSSDAEVARIDFHSVNMRSKKKRDDLPRPMSWEGELSDGERDVMCVDEENSEPVPENLSLPQSKQSLSDPKESPDLMHKSLNGGGAGACLPPQPRFCRPFGVQRVQLADAQSAAAAPSGVDAQPQQEQQRRLSVQLLQLRQRVSSLRLAYAAVFAHAQPHPGSSHPQHSQQSSASQHLIS